jgi:hypothetical protein
MTRWDISPNDWMWVAAARLWLGWCAERRFIGLAVDGSTGCRRRQAVPSCLCRSWKNAQQELVGYRHHVVLLSVVGTGLSLPVDVEPYGPQDSEYNAGQRLLRRAVGLLGRRFADYVVVDGEFATAPFLHTVGDLGLSAVARLKSNLPELYQAAQRRFPSTIPTSVFSYGEDRVEVWDAQDFDPWTSLRWETVRVMFYRQNKPDGTVVEAYWLTDFSIQEVDSQALFAMAKSRWEIENQRSQESAWPGAPLSSSSEQHAGRLASYRTGDDRGPPVSASLPTSRNASYSHSH